MKPALAILLLITASLALAQPYEPIILLDVTGEIGEGLGAGMLISLGDQDGDGLEDILSVTGHPDGGGCYVCITERIQDRNA